MTFNLSLMIKIYLCGDFNADIHTNRGWEHVLEFMKRRNFIFYDLNMLPDGSYTYKL